MAQASAHLQPSPPQLQPQGRPVMGRHLQGGRQAARGRRWGVVPLSIQCLSPAHKPALELSDNSLSPTLTSPPFNSPSIEVDARTAQNMQNQLVSQAPAHGNDTCLPPTSIASELGPRDGVDHGHRFKSRKQLVERSRFACPMEIEEPGAKAQAKVRGVVAVGRGLLDRPGTCGE